MGTESTSGLTLIAIPYEVGFLISFLRSNYYLTLLIGFVGVLLIIGLSIRIDGQEKKSEKLFCPCLSKLDCCIVFYSDLVRVFQLKIPNTKPANKAAKALRKPMIFSRDSKMCGPKSNMYYMPQKKYDAAQRSKK